MTSLLWLMAAPLVAAPMALNVDITAVIVALIGAGLLDWARNLLKARMQSRKAGIAALSPEGRATAHLALVDSSLIIAGKARDELEADNTRLRVELDESRRTAARERLDHAAEREAWRIERSEMRAEMDAMEQRLRRMRERLDGHDSSAQ